MNAKDIGGVAPAAWFALGGLVVVVAVPFVAILCQAIFPEIGTGSFAKPFSLLGTTLADARLLRMTGNTVLLGTCVVIASSLLAIPLGVARALYRVPLAPVWDVLLLVPFMIPPYIATLGWIMTLQPRGYLEQLFGFNLASVLFSLLGMTLVMTFNTFPVVYFAVSRTVEAVGARYADVGRVFGATPARAFWRITLPLSAPGLAASLLLVFAAAIEEYGTPAALGRRAGFDVLVTGIDTRVGDWPIDLPGAATLSLLLVALSLAAFLLQRWILARRSYQTVSGKPQNVDKRPLGYLKLPVLALFGAIAFLSTFGNTNVTQNVELRTLSGRQVKIRSGDEIPYVKGIGIGTLGSAGTAAANGTTGGSSNSNTLGTAQTETVKTGLTVEMVPRFDSDAELVTTDLKMELKSLVEFVKLDAGNQLGSLTQPRTQDQELSNIVRMRAGQTAVIGGIQYDQEQFDGNEPTFLRDKMRARSQSAGYRAQNVTRNALFIILQPTVTTYEPVE